MKSSTGSNRRQAPSWSTSKGGSACGPVGQPYQTHTPPLDPTVLEDLTRLSSDPTFVDRLLRGFKGDTERLVREIGDALGARRYEVAKDAAHALRGGAASVGAMQLVQVATRIDKATHDMLRLKAAQWTEELVGAANRALLELDSHLEARRRRGLGSGDA